MNYKLLLEEAVVETFEALAVASLVLCHFVYGVVDSIPTLLLSVLGNAELVLASTSLCAHTLLEVCFGVPYYVAEQLSKLGSVLCLFPCVTLESVSYLWVTLTVSLTAHGQIHTNLCALAIEVSVEVLYHFFVNAVFLGYTDNMLLNELEWTVVILKLLELRCWYATLRALCRSLCSFIDETANGADKFLFHNVLVFLVRLNCFCITSAKVQTFLHKSATISIKKW